MNNSISLKNIIKMTLCACLFSIITACGGSKQIVEKSPKTIPNYAFDFVSSDNLASVLKEAGKENKLVFIDVYTTWCLPCKMMDENVFTDQQTADIINKDFISYKVDAEKSNGPIISFNYDVIEYPTLLFLDSAGNVLERKAGAANLRELKNMAQSALDQVVVGD